MKRTAGAGTWLFSAALVVTGVVAVLAAGASASGVTFLPTQLSYAVSGGLGGLALVAVGLALANTHAGRIADADEDRLLRQFVDHTAALVQHHATDEG